MRNIIYRIITSLVLLPLVLTILIVGGEYLKLFLIAVSILACLEVAHIIFSKDILAKLLAVLFCVGIFLPAIVGQGFASVLMFAVPVMLVFHALVLFISSIDTSKYEKYCTLFFWSFYITLSMLSLYWLRNAQNLKEHVGLSFILLACISTWSNDTFAYIGGRNFGKSPLFKRISQKKTWEGFIFGAVCSIAFIFLLKYIFIYVEFDLFHGLTISDLLWISLPSTLLAPFGDLIESRLKRFYDKKDSSQILPGHGGLLDRIDGILIVLPWTALFAFIIRPLC